MAATVYDGMGLARENLGGVGIFAGTMYLAALPGGWRITGSANRKRCGTVPLVRRPSVVALSAIMGNNLFLSA